MPRAPNMQLNKPERSPSKGKIKRLSTRRIIFLTSFDRAWGGRAALSLCCLTYHIRRIGGSAPEVPPPIAGKQRLAEDPEDPQIPNRDPDEVAWRSSPCRAKTQQPIWIFPDHLGGFRTGEFHQLATKWDIKSLCLPPVQRVRVSIKRPRLDRLLCALWCQHFTSHSAVASPLPRISYRRSPKRSHKRRALTAPIPSRLRRSRSRRVEPLDRVNAAPEASPCLWQWPLAGCLAPASRPRALGGQPYTWILIEGRLGKPALLRDLRAGQHPRMVIAR